MSDEFTESIKLLENEFIHLMGHIRRSFIESANRVSPGLLPGNYKVFTMIASNEPITASDTSERMMIDKSAMSRTIKDLEERKLVQRQPDPHDGRASLLTVTAFGRERLAHAKSPTHKSLADALVNFEPAQIEQTAHVMRALYEHREAQ